MADRTYEVESGFNKYILFVSSPMGNKPAKVIPGIGDTLGERLRDQGINFAHEIYHEFLFLGKNKPLFQYWMYRMCAANNRESGDAFFALETYDYIHSE